MSSNPLNHLTPEERARLRELASKATPAPWRWAVERHAVLRLLDEIERRPPPLVWRKEPPDQPGWWWYLESERHAAQPLFVSHDGRNWCVVLGPAEWREVERYKGQWSGPIPQPSEASE